MTVAPRWRLAPLAVALAVALVACGSNDDEDGATPSTNTPPSSGTSAPASTAAGGTGAGETVIAVTVRGRSVEGSSRRRVTLNQRVRITVTSDVADEVHVHGYDERVEVRAGQPAELSFVADIPGVFEVEFERSRRTLFSLEVQP